MTDIIENDTRKSLWYEFRNLEDKFEMMKYVVQNPSTVTSEQLAEWVSLGNIFIADFETLQQQTIRFLDTENVFQ